MSNSKPLPAFTFDVLYYLNRDQLERFSIVCRPLKIFIERYFRSKPYRVFDYLRIRGGSYALIHNGVRWHPNRNGYSVQQFLAGQRYIIDTRDITYYLFADMRPHLGPTVRIKWTIIYVAGGITYNPEHIDEMESIAYLWRDGNISIKNNNDTRIVAENFQPILYSPTILQCQLLYMSNAYFLFKDYNVLYKVKCIEISYFNEDPDSYSWLNFLEQPEAKPIVALNYFSREIVNNLLDRLSKAFSSAVVPNAFMIVFRQFSFKKRTPLTEFRATNKASGEILELKNGIPKKTQTECPSFNCNIMVIRHLINNEMSSNPYRAIIDSRVKSISTDHRLGV